jgi:polysaccharide biosynthesis transport protein
VTTGVVVTGREFVDNLTGSEKTLRDYVDVLLRRGWVVVTVFVIVVLISVAYTFTRTPLYTAVASVELEEKSSKAKDKDSLYSQPEYDQFKGYLATQLEILKSRSLAEALVSRMNLAEHQEFASKNWFSTLWSRATADEDGGKATTSSDARKSAIAGQVVRRVNVKPVKQSNLVQISMDATDPAFAGKLLQNLIDLYLERNLEKRRQDSLQAAAWLRDELASADKKLRESQVALLDFVVDHGIVDSKDGALAQVLTLVNKRMEGHVRSQEARAKVQAMDQQNTNEEAAMLLPREVNNEYLGKLKQDLAMMESEYTQMRGIYSLNYPKLLMLDKKIRFLRDRISTIEKNLVSSALDMAKQEEKLLKGSLDSAKQEASRVRSLEAQYSSLKKDVDTGTEFQRILLKEYKQTDIRARTISNDIRIVDPPSMPGGPSWPKKRLFLLVGCVLGLVAGIAGAFVVDQFDDTVQSPRELDTDFRVKRLGTVPHMGKLVSGAEIDTGNGTSAYEFLAYDHPKTPVSDSIRNIQASIFLSNPETPVQCMLVTSASPSEGKTLVAVSIASVLTADSTKRVVIVDCDLRKPRVHKVFGNGDSDVGLSSFLKSNSVHVSDLIHHHRIPGLFFITAGRIPRDPFQLLQSNRMKNFTEELRAAFDYVIYDSPPVLGLPDVPMICSQVDGVIMIARQGHVGRHELKEAVDVLSSVAGCRLLGVVMNMAHAPGWYAYSSRYGSNYHYGGYHHKYYSQKQT